MFNFLRQLILHGLALKASYIKSISYVQIGNRIDIDRGIHY